MHPFITGEKFTKPFTVRGFATIPFLLYSRSPCSRLTRCNKAFHQRQDRRRLRPQLRIQNDRMVVWFHPNQKAQERIKMRLPTTSISPNIKRTPLRHRRLRKPLTMLSGIHISHHRPLRSHLHPLILALRTPPILATRHNSLILSNSMCHLHILYQDTLDSHNTVLVVN